MRKIGLYPRVSTEEQAKVEEGSIKNQIESLQRWVQGENLKYEGKWGRVYDVYTDDGFSGKNLSRPGIRRLIVDISKGRVDTVLMTEVSRLSRSVKDWIDLRAFFDEHEITFITLRQNFDTSTAMGRAMLSFAIEFAQLEREQTAERVKVSCLARASRGLWTGGPIPYGLKATDRPGHLEIDGAKQIIANEIMETFINKAGYLSKTVELINQAGFARDSKLPWTIQTLGNWMQCHALVGEVQVNTKNKDADQDKLRDAERYQIVPAVWDALIPKDIWLQARALLARNFQRLKVPQWKNHEFVLTGLLECSEGKTFSGTSGTGRSGTKFVQYRHGKNDLGNCTCGMPTVRADELEEKVIRELKKLARDPAVIQALVVKANDDFNAKRPDLREVLQSASRRLAGAVKRLDAAADMALEAGTDAEKRMWVEKAQRVQVEKEQVEREIAEANKNKDAYQGSLLKAEDIVDALERFDAGFHDLPVATKQSFITAILEKAVIQKQRITLVIKNPDLSLEGFGRNAVSGCCPGVPKQAHCKEWLGSFDSALSAVPPPKALHHIEYAAALMARDRDFLYQEYVVAGKSTKQIAREQDCSHTTVSKYLLEFDMPPRVSGLPHQRRGQVAYGQRMVSGSLIAHKGEQEVIAQLLDRRSQGASYGDLVVWLNDNQIKTKNGCGGWDRPTVYKIVQRALANTPLGEPVPKLDEAVDARAPATADACP
jgi:site-specific DNA recombinase